MRTGVLLAAVAGIALVSAGSGARQTGTPEKAGAAGLVLAPPKPLAFARALLPRAFQLPRDHGPHFEYETEWWYYTGNLATASGRRFGFQLTFFRRGLSPGPPPERGLATNQIYFAHFAVTDLAGGRHRSKERWSRGALGLAGATGEPFRVWLEDWSAEGGPQPSAVRLRAREAGLVLDLELEAKKPLVAHGDRGLSPKSAEPGNASYYVGYTRMSARGRIGTASGPGEEATGEAWFDHEWSTSALGAGAVGWDWFSLQLDDGRELMFFEIRRADGTREPASGGTLVAANGSTRRLLASEVRVEVQERWTSRASGAAYPSRWRLRVPAEALDLEVEATLADQEMRTSFTYWEGAVVLRGTGGQGPVTGVGYVELTGYARSMQGVF